ncbi:hypothetical protein PV08_05513 [Exophiala spinifera]|uniref:Zn(2)-C6 fungal-type domain-containing protein n=1 Tax=Exophiala spinifera TaxID=91928 RepID=A0A0D1ZRS8_9EURO|nr:uncharacterized protein PV08_05513 [Exophiala spinifera]KIW15467.1 hypothetical protein PV08_05513 [Exophiala spinifera]
MSTQPRVSQRQPLACWECTRRKRKCDKTIPCSRCERLGLNCSREIVHIRRRLGQHGSEIQFLTSIREDLERAEPTEIESIVRRLADHIDSLKLGTALNLNASLDNIPDRGRLHNDSVAVVEGQDSAIVTAVEHLAWGRSNGNCYPHRHCACLYRQHWVANSPMNSQSFDFAASPMAAVANLPDCADAERLVSFHLTRIAWHHNCIHCPTFWRQCQAFWQTGKCDHPLWIALYCSILSTTLFCVQNSAQFLEEFDLESGLETAQQLFKTIVEVLYAGNFLQNMSFYAVQAIVISTEVAHNFGLSQLNATLFSAAIRIAECLGVHKIQDGVSPNLTTEEAWHETVEKEVGRRVWCQIIIQDYFAIPFTDSYIINPAQYSTSLASNAHDHDLAARPDSVPTVSTYTRVLATIAKLMPDFVDGLGPLNARKPLAEQYQHVLRMDQRMRNVVQTIPGFLLRHDVQKEALVGWLGIARRSLAITAAEKIIMIHRPFIFRSFLSDAYARTRRTCVFAAVTILREHENIALSGELCLWTHTAFCITAAVILCFEIVMGGTTHTNDRHEMFRGLVRMATSRLEGRKHDVLARRGIFLIGAILAELDGAMTTEAETNEQSTGPDPKKTIDFHDIVKRFSTDWFSLGATAELAPPFVYDGQVYEQAQGGAATAASGAHNQSMCADEDFESWFINVFNTVEMEP